MGAFMIFDIRFETRKDRLKFESKYQMQFKDILVDGLSYDFEFSAWKMFRNPELNPIYFMGFLGYNDPKDMLKACKKSGIKIKFFSWLAINDRNSKWNKEAGRW